MENICYVLCLNSHYNLLRCLQNSKYHTIEVEVEGEDQLWVWTYHTTNYNGYIIDLNKPNERVPAEDTWDGWVPIYNEIYVGAKIKKSKIRMIPFDSLEELEDYVKLLPQIIKEETFKW